VTNNPRLSTRATSFALFLSLLTACSGMPTQPTSAPFVLPSQLTGTWQGHDAAGHPATLTAAHGELAGATDSAPVTLRDDHTLIVGHCAATWDQLWTDGDHQLSFTTNFCVGGGRWTLTRAAPK
jgi:hypothetical protein